MVEEKEAVHKLFSDFAKVGQDHCVKTVDWGRLGHSTALSVDVFQSQAPPGDGCGVVATAFEVVVISIGVAVSGAARRSGFVYRVLRRSAPTPSASVVWFFFFVLRFLLVLFVAGPAVCGPAGWLHPHRQDRAPVR